MGKESGNENPRRLPIVPVFPPTPSDWSGAHAGQSDTLVTMPKQLLIAFVVAILVGGIYFFLNYDIQSQQENGKACWKIVPKGSPATASGVSPGDSSAGSLRPTIRIATYQLGRLDDTKLANRRVSDVLMRLLPRFDLVALQGVRGKNQGVLVRLIEQINATSGRSYDFATCPTQQRDGLEHYSAFLFDRGRIDVDRTTVHFVDDRLGRIRIKPLVGSFRVRGPDPAQAFTFTLVNVETDPDHATAELDVLAEVFRAVRDDGRGEDDIILLGDLENDDQHLGQLGKLLGVTALRLGHTNHHPRRQSNGQYPPGPSGYQRVYRTRRGRGYDAGVRADHAGGARRV